MAAKRTDAIRPSVTRKPASAKSSRDDGRAKSAKPARRQATTAGRLQGDKTIRLGIVGACGRGKSFRHACERIEGLRIEAVCDIHRDGLEQARQALGAKAAYDDYDTMLAKADLDAVILGTPMHLHAPQAIVALNQGLHVISEVTAGISMAQCQALVAAAKASAGMYMMAENYIFTRSMMVVAELVRQGLMGTPYYAEGEYLHELKQLNERTRWRRRWQTGINGITYGTHSLGPILQCMPGDRVMSVSCAGSGRHHRDPRGAYYENEASCVMLARTARGALIKIRVDMLSDRPHAMNNHIIQGTDGCFESGRGIGEDSIWLRSIHPPGQWAKVSELGQQYLPDEWKLNERDAASAGHGGGDYIEMLAFRDAVWGRRPNPVDIHAAMDMTLPGLVSQASIEQSSAWLPVPDSRLW